MPSSNRIPRDKINLGQKTISVNDELMVTDDLFEKTMIQKQIDESQKRISEHETQSMQEIEEKQNLIFEEAKAKGYEEGLRQAVDEAKAELRAELQEEFDRANEVLMECNDRLARVIAETEGIRNHYMEKRKDEIVDLVMALVSHVATSAANMDPSVMEEVFKNSVEQIQYSTHDLFIRVHPSTEEVVLKYYGEQLPSRVHIMPDLSLHPLDFIFETDRELIDATLQEKLKLIEDGVRGIIHDRQGEN